MLGIYLNNTIVSNHFHSVKILLFSSARSRDVDGKEYEWIYLQTLKQWFVGTDDARLFPFGTKKASIAHTIYRMIYFSWNNCTCVHMFSKFVKFWKYQVDLFNEIMILEMIFGGWYLLNIIPICSRTSYSRCSYCFLFYSS
jgi:hypothetical protein